MIDISLPGIEGLISSLIVAYIIGSMPFGLILCSLFGYGDIRKIGSGNIGATNVLRTGNKFLAFLTLVLDSGKGAFVVWWLNSAIAYVAAIDTTILAENGLPVNPKDIFYVSVAILHGFAAILGHCFPVWLKFKGGKGVATTLGTLLAAVPWTGVLACVTWGVVAGIFRYSSLSALAAMALAPVYTLIFYGAIPAGINVLIAALVFWRHKDNIKRLLAGSEPKIGEKKDKQVTDA